MVQRIARLCCQHQLLSSVSRQLDPSSLLLGGAEAGIHGWTSWSGC